MSKRQTWSSLIRDSYVEKSQGDESGRYYVPADALVGQPSPSGFVKTVVDSIKRKIEAQRPALQGERVISGRQPTFLDVVINRAAGYQTRQEDDFDRALQSEFDEGAAIADLLEMLDSEKSYNGPSPGDYITKSGTNVSAIARNVVAKLL